MTWCCGMTCFRVTMLIFSTLSTFAGVIGICTGTAILHYPYLLPASYTESENANKNVVIGAIYTQAALVLLHGLIGIFWNGSLKLKVIYAQITLISVVFLAEIFVLSLLHYVLRSKNLSHRGTMSEECGICISHSNSNAALIITSVPIMIYYFCIAFQVVLLTSLYHIGKHIRYRKSDPAQEILFSPADSFVNNQKEQPSQKSTYHKYRNPASTVTPPGSNVTVTPNYLMCFTSESNTRADGHDIVIGHHTELNVPSTSDAQDAGNVDSRKFATILPNCTTPRGSAMDLSYQGTSEQLIETVSPDCVSPIEYNRGLNTPAPHLGVLSRSTGKVIAKNSINIKHKHKQRKQKRKTNSPRFIKPMNDDYSKKKRMKQLYSFKSPSNSPYLLNNPDTQPLNHSIITPFSSPDLSVAATPYWTSGNVYLDQYGRAVYMSPVMDDLTPTVFQPTPPMAMFTTQQSAITHLSYLPSHVPIGIPAVPSMAQCEPPSSMHTSAGVASHSSLLADVTHTQHLEANLVGSVNPDIFQIVSASTERHTNDQSEWINIAIPQNKRTIEETRETSFGNRMSSFRGQDKPKPKIQLAKESNNQSENPNTTTPINAIATSSVLPASTTSVNMTNQLIASSPPGTMLVNPQLPQNMYVIPPAPPLPNKHAQPYPTTRNKSTGQPMSTQSFPVQQSMMHSTTGNQNVTSYQPTTTPGTVQPTSTPGSVQSTTTPGTVQPTTPGSVRSSMLAQATAMTTTCCPTESTLPSTTVNIQQNSVPLIHVHSPEDISTLH